MSRKEDIVSSEEAEQIKKYQQYRQTHPLTQEDTVMGRIAFGERMLAEYQQIAHVSDVPVEFADALSMSSFALNSTVSQPMILESSLAISQHLFGEELFESPRDAQLGLCYGETMSVLKSFEQQQQQQLYDGNTPSKQQVEKIHHAAGELFFLHFKYDVSQERTGLSRINPFRRKTKNSSDIVHAVETAVTRQDVRRRIIHLAMQRRSNI